MKIPDVEYARSGDVSIAYQALGSGPIDLVFVRGTTGDLLSSWDQPLLVRHLEGLADFVRLLMLDKRGTGLSDRVREVPTLEARMDDVRAVMDAAGSERAVLWSAHEGTRITTLFAATYPERTSGLALFDPSARGVRGTDYPWAPTEAEWRQRLREIGDGWGKRDFFARLLSEWAPSVADDELFFEWFVIHMRRSLSPGAALAFFRMAMAADVSDVLGAARVPTLILFRPSERGPAEYFGTRIAGAQLVELPGLRDIYTWVDEDTDEFARRMIERLATGADAAEAPDRVLATVLFTDIVGSTRRAAEVGDRAWRELLERHHTAIRHELARFRGEELDTAGDGFLATFDGPARAIRCACAIRDAVGSLGIEVRVGLHTGECERLDGRLGGIAVHIGARICALAAS
jgi:pimeloyl-ACP methyl ester carboxylesterase